MTQKKYRNPPYISIFPHGQKKLHHLILLQIWHKLSQAISYMCLYSRQYVCERLHVVSLSVPSVGEVVGGDCVVEGSYAS